MSQRVWFITGTSSGFGRRLAKIVLSRGDRVIATVRSLDRPKPLTEEIDPNWRDRLRMMQLDVLEGIESLKKKGEEANGYWGRIDVLVNNAGLGYPAIAEESGSALLRKQFDTNVFGLMDVTAAIVPHMRRRRSGSVVVIGSRSVWTPDRPGIATYAASKAAVHSLTETLAAELAEFNIKVLLVAPGAFRTEKIYAQKYSVSNPISDYDEYRKRIEAKWATSGGTEKGDPDRAMEVLADVVRGEGVAEGKPWPGLLVLGEDADADVRAKFKKTLEVLDAWKDVAFSTSFDARQEAEKRTEL